MRNGEILFFVVNLESELLCCTIRHTDTRSLGINQAIQLCRELEPEVKLSVQSLHAIAPLRIRFPKTFFRLRGMLLNIKSKGELPGLDSKHSSWLTHLYSHSSVEGR